MVEQAAVTVRRAGRVRLNLSAALSFVVGGSLFSLGALFAEADVTLKTVNVTYLVGGFFFSLGGYLSVVFATDRLPGTSGSWLSRTGRWWRAQPNPLGSWSALVLFVGTLLFAVSLVAAFAEGLTPRQSNGWIWVPDILGCICFLVSGHLGVLDVCDGHVGVRLRSLTWWVVAVNQIGSVLFFLAGLAAFIRPATSEPVNLALVNWGTFAGAACFVVGGVLQAFDRPGD